jgi:hypothetical protein
MTEYPGDAGRIGAAADLGVDNGGAVLVRHGASYGADGVVIPHRVGVVLPQREGTMKIQVIAGLALAAGLTAGCGSHAAAATGRPHPVLALGTISVATSCSDTSSYPDVQPGSQVIVTNSAGTVIATASLDTGHAKDAITPYVCRYPFDVKVPGGLPRYGIEIGHNRGTVWFSQSQMRNGPILTLGS